MATANAVRVARHFESVVESGLLRAGINRTMKFSEVIDEATALLQERGRMSLRALKREFELDDAALADLEFELVNGDETPIERDGVFLVWMNAHIPANEGSVRAEYPIPASYTPTHLAERILAEQQAMEARGVLDGERKTITALFADLQSSTAMIERLDPEEARAIIDPALQVMMDAVHHYEGYVAQALGDGILALFGAPIAHEDHPQRALFAALQMQEEMRAYSDRVRLKTGTPIELCVGINTGEVVVRSIRKDDLTTDYVPVGHSTHVAARMQQMATGGSILITEQTRKLTEGYFNLKPLGQAEVKGSDTTIGVYEVQSVGPLRTKLQMAQRRGLSRFVGRQNEVLEMQHVLAEVEAGNGQILGVMGEPGVGKSRLFFEFKLAAPSGCMFLEAFAASYGKRSSYLPIIELLKNYFRIRPSDDQRARREKVLGKVLALDRSLENSLPYLFSVLGLVDVPSSLEQMDPTIRRERTFEALKTLILRESMDQPVVIMFEDLHWIDRESQGFLDTLAGSLANARVALLVNYRPEYRHEWMGKTYYTQMRLKPLGPEAAGEMLNFLMGDDTNLEKLKALILERTDGTPFFIEEVVQTLVEDGVLLGRPGDFHIEEMPRELKVSPTVRGVLGARIDRLESDEKALLQQLAVIGRSFPLDLVRRVVDSGDKALGRLISSLQAKEFLYEQPGTGETEFIFKHALTQDVAYRTVLQEQRKVLHCRTAEALESLHWSEILDYSAELAYHYMQGGNVDKAVEYLHMAGKRAAQRSANDEAISHLTQALTLIEKLPESDERAKCELAARMDLGALFNAVRGWASQEAEDQYSRAYRLCELTDDKEHVFPAVLGLTMGHSVRADFATFSERGNLLLEIAEQKNSDLHRVCAYWARGTGHFHTGRFSDAVSDLEKAVDAYDPRRHAEMISEFSMDYGIFALSYLSHALWCLGYPEQATRKSEEAQTCATDLNHSFTIGMALDYAAMLRNFVGDTDNASRDADLVTSICTEHGFGYYLGWGVFLRGWSMATMAEVSEGLTRMREGLKMMESSGARLRRPYYLALIAEAEGASGTTGQGLDTLNAAFVEIERTQENCWKAELLRCRGDLAIASGERIEVDAEQSYLEAIETARAQQARSFELRAATRLARLWQTGSKRLQAFEMLREAYDQFTEGFDTKDLLEAKALLEALDAR